MLLGRSDAQARIAALLDHARSGVSAALILRGEPGIGKSALLQFAALKADAMTVLSATGIEAESELPYAGLSELLLPVLELLPEIPGPQADALAAALALRPAIAQDPFPVLAATLSLLALAAERQPVLALVDDAQWLDAASRDALLFVARRLHADRAALLFAVREGEPIEFRPPGVPELVLGGLDYDAARDLIAHSAASPVSAVVVDRMQDATRGNPLAILESLQVLSPEQLAGMAPLEEPLPTGPGIQRSYERRVARLTDETRKTLLLVAASGSGSIDEVRRAGDAFGARLSALDRAEVAGLIRNDGLRLQFQHPLIRAAVYHGATAPDRRAAHAALATALTDSKSLVARAWHLAAAAQGEDEQVAATLAAAAVEARGRSGLAAASRAFERAARLTPDSEQRAARLHEAGTDAYVGGESQRGIALLDEARELAGEIPLQAAIAHSRARAEMWTGSPARARRILLHAVDQIEDADPASATLMLVDAATTAIQEGDVEADFKGTVTEALRVAERAYRVGLRAGGQPEAAAAGAYGKALLAFVRPDQSQRDEAHRLLLQSLEAIDEGESLQLAVQLINSAASFLFYEEFDRMRVPLESLIAAARNASAPGALPYALGHLSELDFRTGRWAQAYAEASEAVALATELGHMFSLIYALACLGWIEAARGMEADCRAHLTRLAGVSPHAKTIVGGYSARIGGLLHLGYGRNEEAITYLEPLSTLLRSTALVAAPWLFQETPDLIEAYVHVGRRSDAALALAAFDNQAAVTIGTWSRAAAERCRGLLEDDFAPAFKSALKLHDSTSMPFERARTELCYGERLRRAKQRSEAREHLHWALDTFEAIGAEPWAERARNELRATGETIRRGRAATDDLTLQELQVALKVAEGKTNREAAAALFISPKTVEAHLSRIYSKLGLRSRTELAHRFVSSEGRALATAER
ncbi:MAG: LuxR family transcriptional regulator [Candidatus Dormibacteraeota bacterium]|nr:LuxR family transcriptional regulator [Candidatus Dormibacteraeota bacterium]